MGVKDLDLLPRIEECIESLDEAWIFSTLNAFNGYWQVDISKEDCHKTSLVCHSGALQYLRMSFGLTEATETFQSVLYVILKRWKWKTCLVYVEYITIFSKDIEEHPHHVDKILTTPGKDGVTLKLKKCRIFSYSVEYIVNQARLTRSCSITY